MTRSMASFKSTKRSTHTTSYMPSRTISIFICRSLLLACFSGALVCITTRFNSALSLMI